MQDDLDTCRICSAPAEPEAPLFHPCKCSGTIRYIHQDCLTTWLAHSKKKTCDVCKYQYSFTKVYSDNMPKQIPLILFLRKFIQKVFWGIVLGLRAIMVVTIWLAVLPYITVWTWRFYFVLGENIAWWTYDKPRPNPSPVFYSYFTNFTYTDNLFSKDSNATFIDFVTSYPAWRALSSDIFTGQIIASIIVLLFLGVFLLREWIMQNARPGIFEEEIHPEQVEVQDAAMEPNPQEEEQAMPGLDHIPQAEPAVDEPLDMEEPVSASSSSTGAEENLKRDDEEVAADVPHRGYGGDGPPTRRTNTSISSTRNSESSTERDDGSTSLADSPFRGSDDVSLADYPFTFSSSHLLQSNGSDEVTESQRPMPLTFATLEAHEQAIKNASQISPPNEATNVIDNRPIPSRPTLANINLSAPEFQEDLQTTLVSPGRSMKQIRSQPQPSPSLSTYNAPEQLEGGSSSNPYDDNRGQGYFPEEYTPHDSDAGSESSSAAATVLDFREEIDEYFVDEDAASDVEEIDEQDLNHNGDHANVLEEPREEAAGPIEAAAVRPENELRDIADEVDGFNEDDVDGALEEAIGMRGPLSTVFQNAALVIFVLDTTIGLAVWAPFTLGKTFALLALDPPRLMHVINSPIRLIRFVTDPLVDFCIFAFMRSVKPIIEPFGQTKMASTWNTTQSPITLTFNVTFLERFMTGNVEGGGSALERGLEHLASSPTASFLEPYFAALGKEVRVRATTTSASWIELANDDDSTSRFFAIILGYALAAFLLTVYLNIIAVGSVQSAGRAVRNAIRQQLVVLKVVVFIMIELVFFPLGCGVMLDLFTIDLFPDATVANRLAFFRYAPMTSVFYHWMIGTMFMYQFAILLGGCRKLLRQGALWFIRDPQDQNFHPIKDILERPTFTQLRKLALSAVMYSIVVALGMGGMVFSLKIWGSFILPLRWKTRQPLSTVPVDLLFMHVVMPYTIKFFRPRRYTTALARDYWKWAARFLRLSSYLFGEMRSEETRPSKDLRTFLRDTFKSAESNVDESKPQVDGRYRRVPAQDNITVPREINATVPVDAHGDPLDEAGKRLMDLQDAEAIKAKRDPAQDYTIVYLPPRFRERILAFMALIWIAGSFVSVAAFVIPTLFGRAVFKLFIERDVHDGYSLVVGLYLLCGCFYTAHVLDRMDKRRQRSNEEGPRGEWAVYVFKRSMLWMGNFLWVAFWLGVVIPTLIGLVMECYVVHPVRLIFDPNLVLKIQIYQSWAKGLVYIKLVMATTQLRPEYRVDAALKEMRDNGWRRLDAVPITLDIIAPVMFGLAALLLFPLAIVLGVKQAIPDKVPANVLFIVVYPGLFTAAAIANAVPAIRKVLRAWAQQIRDSEFLVEMRLRNLEPESKPEAKSEAKEIDSDAKDAKIPADTSVETVQAINEVLEAGTNEI